MDHNELRWSLDAARWASDVLHFSARPIQCAVLDLAIHRGILNCCRQWGKSTLTALKAVHRAWFEPESLIIALSPTARQSGEFVEKAAGFLRRLDVKPRGDGRNDISLRLPNGSRIVGLPGKEGNIRGFSRVRLMLIDEAARVPDDLYHAVRPMLAVGSGDLWLMSTPFGKRGFFWKEWSSQSTNWTRIASPHTDCPHFDPAFIREERLNHTQAWFRQEYECAFTSSDDSLFKEEDLRKCLRSDIPPLVPGGRIFTPGRIFDNCLNDKPSWRPLGPVPFV